MEQTLLKIEYVPNAPICLFASEVALTKGLKTNS